MSISYIKKANSENLTGRLRVSLRVLNPKKGDMILDIGCKKGWLEKFLRTNEVHLVALDIDKNEMLQDKNIKKKANRVCADANSLPFQGNCFDKATLFEVLEHIPKIFERRVLKEINRVLKSGGILVLSTPNDHLIAKLLDPAFPLIGHRHYGKNYLINLLKTCGFSVVKVFKGGRWMEAFYVPIFYMFNCSKISIPFETLLNNFIDREYRKSNGWYTVILKSEKR